MLMNEVLSIKLFREFEQSPAQSHRSLSLRFDTTLGSIHYCVNALIKKGYVKAKNFKNAQNKLAYAYILTPTGITRKRELALAFLSLELAEFEALHKEIKSLEDDLKCSGR